MSETGGDGTQSWSPKDVSNEKRVSALQELKLFLDSDGNSSERLAGVVSALETVIRASGDFPEEQDEDMGLGIKAGQGRILRSNEFVISWSPASLGMRMLRAKFEAGDKDMLVVMGFDTESPFKTIAVTQQGGDDVDSYSAIGVGGEEVGFEARGSFCRLSVTDLVYHLGEAVRTVVQNTYNIAQSKPNSAIPAAFIGAV